MSDAPIRIAWASPDIGDDEIREVTATLRSGRITMGPTTRRFEDGIAQLLDVDHAVATTSGTVALQIAFAAMGVGPGDEVIVPAFTYVATVNAIAHTGATPVMVDVEPVTLNLDPAQVRASVSARTRAVVAIDYGGCAADYDALAPLARERGIALLQDAAHSLGGHHRDRQPGAVGAGATLSFHAAKLITTGEGGMFVTNDAALAERARTLRNQGEPAGTKYTFTVIGQNARLSDLQAAVGLAQLPKLPRLLARRREVASWYRERLGGATGITLLPEPPHVRHAYFLFSILCADTVTRDRAEAALAAAGVETRICWPRPVYRQPAYAKQPAPRRPCPVAESAASRVLSLPIHPAMSAADVAHVAGVLRSAVS
jgi:perosamine synthetase